MAEKRHRRTVHAASPVSEVGTVTTAPSVVSAERLDAFVERVLAEGTRLYRDLPWRRTRDPYEVLVSEVMLQQTQVARVERYYQRWLERFPSLEALAAADLADVLALWQGMGYQRRVLALKRLAEHLVDAAPPGGHARLPRETSELLALPGVGPATAAGVRAFAFDEPGVYLETNVRAVLLHELFADSDGVSDAVLRPVAHDAAMRAHARVVEPRVWNYALLDYGVHLKRTLPNPSRRSKHHARQSKFEGSARQKRAWLLRAVLDAPGVTLDELAQRLASVEQAAGRIAPSPGEVLALLEALHAEGFLARDDDAWRVR